MAKIILITTYPSAEEVSRIEEEVLKMGHEYKLINLLNFNFQIQNNQFQLEALKEAGDAEVVIIRGIFNAIRTIGVITNYMRAKGTKVFDNNLSRHGYAINKIADMTKLALHKVPVPDTYYSRNFNDYSSFSEQNGFPAIIKSTRMGKGAGVFKVDSQSELDQFIKESKASNRNAKNYLFQEYVKYELDLRVLVVGTDMFTMRRIPPSGDFRANFSLGGSVELHKLDQQNKTLAIQAMQAVDLEVGGVDILKTHDGERCILEVNHTAGMVGMEKATKKNIVKLYVDHAIKNAR